MAFRVGQKVYCVRGERIGGYGSEIFPVEGVVYTIREFAEGGYLTLNEQHIRLEEITNPTLTYLDGYHEAAFCVSRFRPLVNRRTDISALEALLNPNRELAQ